MLGSGSYAVVREKERYKEKKKVLMIRNILKCHTAIEQHKLFTKKFVLIILMIRNIF